MEIPTFEGHRCICEPNMHLLLVCAQMPMAMPTPTPMQDEDDGQSMIVEGSLVDKPNEPKIQCTPDVHPLPLEKNWI